MIYSLSVKKSCVFAVLIFLSLTIYAAEINIVWKWHPIDDGITHYRYQKDGEDEDKWQVVDATVNSYSAGPLDASKVHVLYLQKSYDGINWSISGTGKYDPKIYGYPETADEKTVEGDSDYAEEPGEDQAADIEAVDIGVSEARINNSNLKQVPDSTSTSSTSASYGLELSFGLGNLIGFDKANRYADLPGTIFPAGSVDFILNNLVSDINGLNLGLITGLGFQLYSPQVSKVQFLDVHALVTLSYALDYNLSFRFGFGAAALSPYANLSQNTISFFDPSDINIFYGVAGKLSFLYAINNSYILGMQADGRMLFSDAFAPYEGDGFLSVFIGYRF
ncbi:MAG: hypothetical protein K9L21_04335 [Spirochaetia bacterium]|nr:hypothetical protein [Spirochaetia bacterium]